MHHWGWHRGGGEARQHARERAMGRALHAALRLVHAAAACHALLLYRAPSHACRAHSKHPTLHANKQVASFVRQHLYNAATRQLRRAYTNGPSAVPGFADDYACEQPYLTSCGCAHAAVQPLAEGSAPPGAGHPWLTTSAAPSHACADMVGGLLDLYSATGDVAHLQVPLLAPPARHRKKQLQPPAALLPCRMAASEVRARAPAAPRAPATQWALELQRTMQELFWDADGGAYFNNKARGRARGRGRFQHSACPCLPAMLLPRKPVSCGGSRGGSDAGAPPARPCAMLLHCTRSSQVFPPAGGRRQHPAAHEGASGRGGMGAAQHMAARVST